jgi:hypothetical protein
LQVKALRLLAGVTALLLTRFTTNLEEDRRLLQDGAEGFQSADVRMAVQFRMEKKQVLSELLQDIGHRIRVSHKPQFLGFCTIFVRRCASWCMWTTLQLQWG